MEFIRICGVLGLIILFVTIALFVIGVILLCLAKSKKPLAIFTIVALLPLGLGICGTMIGYSHVRMATEKLEGDKTEVVQIGRRQAECTSYLGLEASGLLLCLGIAGLLTRKNTAQ